MTQSDPQPYVVQLAIVLRAGEPGDAVAGLVDLFTEHGLRNWTYRVHEVDPDDTDRVGNLVGYFDGWGESKLDPTNRPRISVDLPTIGTPVTTVVRADSSEPSDTVKDDDTTDELTEYAASIHKD